jgi:nucleoid DNA-binding protein
MNNVYDRIYETLAKEFNISKKQAERMVEKFFLGFRRAIDTLPDKVSIKNFGEFNKTKITDRHKYRRMIKLRRKHNEKVKRYLKKNPEKYSYKKLANKNKEL